MRNIKENSKPVTWRAIPGYKGMHFISTMGEVFSCTKMPGIRKAVYRGDYLAIGLIDENRVTKMHSIHRLVAMTFISPIKGKHFVNHINGVKNDNRVSNLEWCNRSENGLHAYKLGLMTPTTGEDSHLTKLTDAQVLEISKIGKKSGESMASIAKRYSVSSAQVCRILNGKTRVFTLSQEVK
jgi:hypothetical protein